MVSIPDAAKETLSATSPIIAIVLLMQIFILKSPPGEILLFLGAAIMVIAGFILFLIGVRLGMLPIGEAVGSEMSARGSLLFIAVMMFVLSFLVTIAEPDVRVLTTLVDSVSAGMLDRNLLIFVIGFGVSFFMVVSALRTLYGISIKKVLLISYLMVIILSFFTPSEFLAISFDAGGVTTGPMAVPVILSLGVGITSVLSQRTDISNTFGFIGLASVGPILGIMLMGVFLA
ncbi:MAG: hypothetical protein PWQ88_561 [Candidatus Methanomethylophilaceae archaeon]|nr:hypothetical protein [Candidatus Methanomethylophilaceae archaeon]MDI3541604.1 hypothetical protein [Candidatus Methanomethylophilaceae archaeon]